MAAGVYPGSFNPPTVAHLAIVELALEAGRLERIDLAVSESPLGKGEVEVPSLDDRMAVLAAVAATRPWLGVVRSPHQLIAELADGYDAVVMGSDKWAQVLDPVWYGGSTQRRDEAVARLPRVLVVARADHPVAAGGPVPGDLLAVGDGLARVSSSAVRNGRVEWMLPEAAALDAATGAWSDPDRYRRLRGLPDSRSGGR